MEKYRKLMLLIQQDNNSSWINQQLEDTFSEGISMNVKELGTDSEYHQTEPADISAKERNKRNKYETSRPYTEHEKYQLVIKALERVFLELPEIQLAAFNNLNELCDGIESIEFFETAESDEAMINTQNIAHLIDSSNVERDNRDLNNDFKSFIKDINK